MTSQHLSREEFDGFRTRALSGQALQRADQHLAGCQACRDELAQDLPSGAALLAAVDRAGRRHLAFEELEALLDGGAMSATIRQHLDDCGTCRQELEDLRAFDALPASAREQATERKTAPAKHDVRTAWWRVPSFARVGALAVPSYVWAGALAALVSVAIILPRMLGPGGPAPGGPEQFVVRAQSDTSTTPGGARGLGPGSASLLPADAMLALGEARTEAIRTGQPQTVQLELAAQEYEALTLELRAIGTIVSVPDVGIPPGGDERRSVSITVLPPAAQGGAAPEPRAP
jgi:hypothetical protein